MNYTDVSYIDRLVFVDCEADGPSPAKGVLTEFGAVHFTTKRTFHGKIWNTIPSVIEGLPRTIQRASPDETVFLDFKEWLSLTVSGQPVFVSDNPAFDWQWINDGFWRTLDHNPFGHSARRIGDFYAGLKGNFGQSQNWKKWRKTPHTHHPVDDALGNVEAFERILQMPGMRKDN